MEERSVAEVPAAAPVTEPVPKTPDGTCRTMVTGRTPEEAEWRRTVEERSMAEVPVAAPVTDPAPVPAGGGALAEAFPEAYLRRIAKERPAAEVPAAAPVTEPAPAPVPRTPDGTWRVMVAGSRGGGPRRGFSPLDRYFGSDRKDRERRAPTIDLRRGSWNGRKSPPSRIKVVLVLLERE